MLVTALLCTSIPLLLSMGAPLPKGGAAHSLPLPGAVTHVPLDTGTTTELPLIRLTVGRLTRYLAVQQALTTFWQHHPRLLRASRARYTFPIQAPWKGKAGDQTIWVPDVAAVAARDPVVAAIFQHCHFPPAQFVPMTIAMRQALATAALGEALSWGTTVLYPTSTWAKNIAFVRAHRQALAGAGVDFEW